MFQLFLPAPAASEPRSLEAAGLADFVDNASFLRVSKGPTGERGNLVFWQQPGRSPRFGYRPDQQEWVSAKAWSGLPAGRYWIGFDKESPLGPETLKRVYQHRGRRLTLGDGREWLIPSARELPQDLILADDGSLRFEPQRRFHDFCLEVDRWETNVSQAYGDENAEFDFLAVFQFVMQALRLNYRMLPEVSNHLRLVSKETVFSVLLAALGIVPPKGDGNV